FGIARHPDNADPVTGEKPELLSNGVLVGPKLAGACFVDDRHLPAVFTDRAVKTLAAPQRNSHSLQIILSYIGKQHQHAIAARLVLLSLKKNTPSRRFGKQRDLR